MASGIVDQIPLWLLFIFACVMSLVFLEVGTRIGQWRRSADIDTQSAMGNVVGGTLGLLALLLAFTFGMAGSRFDLRKQLLVEQVNNIGTTYLRAEFLPEPHRSEVKALLREYVDIGAKIQDVAHDPAQFQTTLARIEAIHDSLWASAVAVVDKEGPNVINSLFIQSLNATIDIHGTRFAFAVLYRTPAPVWGILLFVSMIAMLAVGYSVALIGKRNIIADLVLAVSFSVVLTLIADLDRGAGGWVTVSQQPMLKLQQQLNAGAGARDKISETD